MSFSYVCASCQSRQLLRLSSRRASTPKITAAKRPLFSSASGFRAQQQRATTPAQNTTTRTGLGLSTITKSHSTATAAASDPLESEDAKIASDTGLSDKGLFHGFSNSPLPSIRRRARYIQRHAYCPHPSHKPTRAPTPNEEGEVETPTLTDATSLSPKHAKFECPDCGIPIYCSKEHWEDSYEDHLKICDTLRQINEDDHDLRSGRMFPEFNYPGQQIVPEALINMTNWDTLLYTRQFEAINDPRSLRQATRLLTYPTTLGSVIHELGPYQYRRGGRVTLEGVKSFSALQYTLHPGRDGSGAKITELKPNPPMVRIFILGARAESSLPRDVWVQLTHMFPGATVHLVFIGPESMANRESEFPLPERTPENPFGMIVEDRVGPQMKISTIVDYFHNIHKTEYFAPYDPYFDAFMVYHPGFGNPASSQEWEPTIVQLLETKVPIICTGYSEQDMTQDVGWVKKTFQGEYDMLLEPGENLFRSLRWDLNDLDPTDISCANWGVWAFRGKRYDTVPKEDRVDESRRLE